MKCLSLAALEVVKMTTSSAASDENFVKMTTFLFQWPLLWPGMIILPTGEAFGPIPTIKSSDQIIYLHWIRPSSSHYDDVIMTMLASQITSLTVVYSIVYSGVNQRKHQSSASLAFVWEIHRGPVNFPHKWPVTRKMFPFDDVIMWYYKNDLFSLWQLIDSIHWNGKVVSPTASSSH